MKRILIDMDGVLCDYYGAFRKAIAEEPEQKFPQSRWGFFLKLKEIPGAIESYKFLEQHFDVRILTRPSFRNVNCYSEKAQWIWDHLSYESMEKAIFSGDKSIVKGDYLIDDQMNANQPNFEGDWIHFATSKFPDWITVVKYICEKENIAFKNL